MRNKCVVLAYIYICKIVSFLKITLLIRYYVYGTVYKTRFLAPVDLVNCSRHLAVRSVLTRRGDSVCCEDDCYDDDEDDGDCEHCLENHNKDCNLHPSVVTGTY